MFKKHVKAIAMLRLLINIHDAKDRYEAASDQLMRQGLDFKRVEAVDGRGKPASAFPQYDALRSSQFFGRELIGGEIGCYLSHLNCVQEFLESDESYCLVLEDDMSAPENLALILDQLIAALEYYGALSWDVINLGRATPNLRTGITSIDPHKLFHAHYFPVTTTALLWSRHGAQAFWDTRDCIYAPVDHFLRNFCCLRGSGLCLDPPLITSTGAESLINARCSNAKMPTKQRAKKQIDQLVFKFWKEFCRQSINYLWATKSFLKTRLGLQ